MAHLAQGTAEVKTRSQTRLSSHLEKNLLAYAAAATAAGVGILTGPTAADAKIIYTPTTSQIFKGGFNGLDLNHDRIYDFRFPVGSGSGCSTGGGCGGFASLRVGPLQQGNQIWESSGYPWCAAALPGSQKVGSSGNFHAGVLIMARATFHMRASGGWESCPWETQNGEAYLGLKFIIKGKVHFGWARVAMIGPRLGGFPPVLVGYAYETVANKPIITGKTKGPDVATMPPDTLGSLAWGRR
jgi:hypothetical protein